MSSEYSAVMSASSCALRSIALLNQCVSVRGAVPALPRLAGFVLFKFPCRSVHWLPLFPPKPVPASYCRSYIPFIKGLIENTNKLVRQYIPKGTNFNTINQQKIKQIQYKITNRPRQKLNFYSPKELFFLNL